MKRLLFFLLFPLLLTGCSLPGKPQEYTETRFLMDTVCTLRADRKEAVLAGFAKLEEIQNFSDFYREDSTVSIFNDAPAGEAVSLDSHTETMVETALTVSEKSGGGIDITIAPVKELWNFQESSLPPTPEEIKQVLPLVGWEFLRLNTKNHTLTKTKDGVKIDLGGVAKGYGADMAKNAMIETGASWGVLDLGGNVLVFGKNPASKDGSWEIGIQTPFAKAGEYEKTVTIEDAGVVVTSGIYQRYFTYEGKYYHHILNPQTGYPAENQLLSVSISGNSGLLADCLSTACLALGKDEGQKLADSFLMHFLPIEKTTEEKQ